MSEYKKARHLCRAFSYHHGRYWTRTSDPIDVNDVLYQAELSGRPFWPLRATFKLNRPGQEDPADQYPQGESNPRLLAENQLS
jgi:hypothetical protein